MLAPLEPACGCRDGLGRAAKTLRSELVAERALARGMDLKSALIKPRRLG